MLCLIVETEGRRARHAIDRSVTRIGRALDNDIVVDSTYVSWHHARVLLVEGTVEVEDLGSHNGTLVAGCRVARHRLEPPGTFQLGSSVFVTIAHAESDDTILASAGEALDFSVPAGEASVATDDRPDARAGELAMRVLAALARSTPATSMQRALLAILECVPARDGAIIRPSTDGRGSGVSVLAWAGEPAELAPSALAAIVVAAREGRAHVEVAASAGAPELHVILADGIALVLPGGRRNLAVEAIRDALALAMALGRRQGPTRAEAPPRRFTLGVVGPAMVDGTSTVITQLHARLAGTLTSDLPVLLRGETGTGKEIYARAIHLLSPRSDRPFGSVNASAIPEDLLESTLFGVEEGAATGVRRQAGLLREADGGTFFFDEIGDMNPVLQAKILRLLDRREVQPVGGRGPVAVDVRFVSATNRDLVEAVAAGRFRKDLYYRLCGHEHWLPALRDRREDVPLHVEAVLRDEAEAASRPRPGVTMKAMRALVHHDWPGNVRELEVTLRRLVHEVGCEPIRWTDLPEPIRRPRARAGGTLDEQVDRFQREVARQALEAHGDNRSRAAKALGIGRNRLRALLSEAAGNDES